MGPIDVAATAAGDFLYALDGKDASLSVYAVAGDGAVTKKNDFAGLPEHAVGLVAR